MLPKINEKIFTAKLPIAGTVKFKPFNVKEQKHFLMQIENDNTKQAKHKLVYELMKNCYSEENKIPIEKLHVVDFDFLYFQIRKYAIGQKLELKFKYTNEKEEIAEDIETEIDIEADINVPDIKPENMSKVFDVDNNIKLTMEYPTIEDLLKAYDYDSDDIESYLVASMLKSVEKDGELYNDFILADAKDFIENLLPSEYEDIVEFLDKNPKLKFDKVIPLKQEGKTINLSEFNYTDFFFFL